MRGVGSTRTRLREKCLSRFDDEFTHNVQSLQEWTLRHAFAVDGHQIVR